MFDVKIITGSNIANYTHEVASLRCDIFKEFPYLYQGNLSFEYKYIENFSKQQDSVLLLAYKENLLIGCSTGMPLLDNFHEELKLIFRENSYNISELYLFGESVIKKDFRQRGLGGLFFSMRENYVYNCSNNKYKFTSFFAIEREYTHPARPKNYYDLSHFWHKKGYVKTDMQVYMSYKEIGEHTDSAKLMSIWIKPLVSQ